MICMINAINGNIALFLIFHSFEIERNLKLSKDSASNLIQKIIQQTFIKL